MFNINWIQQSYRIQNHTENNHNHNNINNNNDLLLYCDNNNDGVMMVWNALYSDNAFCPVTDSLSSSS